MLVRCTPRSAGAFCCVRRTRSGHRLAIWSPYVRLGQQPGRVSGPGRRGDGGVNRGRGRKGRRRCLPGARGLPRWKRPGYRWIRGSEVVTSRIRQGRGSGPRTGVGDGHTRIVHRRAIRPPRIDATGRARSTRRTRLPTRSASTDAHGRPHRPHHDCDDDGVRILKRSNEDHGAGGAPGRAPRGVGPT